MTNAFNECDRSTFLLRARQEFPELFGWVQWCYHSAGELRFGPHRVVSSAGVQQGDPFGPILFSLSLLQLLDSILGRAELHVSLWYLDDGTLVGHRRVVRRILDGLVSAGPQFGLHVNLTKCELYWPSGDQSFPEFPTAITRTSQASDGVELLGSPVHGSPEFFDNAVGQRITKVLAAQAHLDDLDDPQIALHLLRSCLSLCKINHLLRTVPTHLACQQWLRFDKGLRESLGRIIHTSLPSSAWSQATLPCRLGGLSLREARLTRHAAFLGSCNQSRSLYRRLLGQDEPSSPSAKLTSLPREEAARADYRTAVFSPDHGVDQDIDLHGAGQHTLQLAIDASGLTRLRSACSVRDRARLTACAAPHSAAWLWAIPAPALGLAMSRHEFVLALQLWLGVPVFSAEPVQRCVCRQLVDPFGDHLLGCGHGPLRIRRHDALREVLFPCSFK